MLREAGFTVDEAPQRGRRLRAHRRATPDLILLDVDLPDMSGAELLRRLRAMPPTLAVPIVHVSATYVASHDIGAALDSGADGYLTLPVDAVELVATVRAVMRARRAEEAAHQFARQWQRPSTPSPTASACSIAPATCSAATAPSASCVGQPFAEVIGVPFAALIERALGDAARCRSRDLVALLDERGRAGAPRRALASRRRRSGARRCTAT